MLRINYKNEITQSEIMVWTMGTIKVTKLILELLTIYLIYCYNGPNINRRWFSYDFKP